MSWGEKIQRYNRSSVRQDRWCIWFSFLHFNRLFCSSPVQSVGDQVAWGVAMKVFMDTGGTAENQNKTYGPWSCWMDGWMDGLQPLLTSLSPCPAFAFSRLRAPNPSLSAARHKLHKGRGLGSNKPWAKILPLSLALLVTPLRGAAALSLNSFPRLLPCP